MVLHGVRQAGGRSGSTFFNLAVLAGAIPAALAAWAAIGESIGDVLQPERGGLFIEGVTLALSLLYVSLLLYFPFLPGFAVFLLLARQIGRRASLAGVRERAVVLALSPVIALVFYVIPAVPEDRDGVFSGWWFILGTCVIVALLARTPLGSEARSPGRHPRVTP